MGMVLVAPRAASAASSETANIKSTLSRTNSSASAGSAVRGPAAIFDRRRLSIDISDFGKTPQKCLRKRFRTRERVENPDFSNGPDRLRD